MQRSRPCSRCLHRGSPNAHQRGDFVLAEACMMPGCMAAQLLCDPHPVQHMFPKGEKDVSSPTCGVPVQAHGSVVSCRVLCDHAGISKQVAFVQMETRHQALHAIDALHDTRPPAQVPAGGRILCWLAPSTDCKLCCRESCSKGKVAGVARLLLSWQGPASKALHVALAETKQDRQRKARQGGSGHAPNNQVLQGSTHRDIMLHS